MCIEACFYELIQIELSCGDMREIIFSQDFLQYMIFHYIRQWYFTVLDIRCCKIQR